MEKIYVKRIRPTTKGGRIEAFADVVYYGLEIIDVPVISGKFGNVVLLPNKKYGLQYFDVIRFLDGNDERCFKEAVLLAYDDFKIQQILNSATAEK